MTTNQDQQEVKEAYEKPVIEVIEMEMEHPILASSGSGDDFEPGGVW